MVTFFSFVIPSLRTSPPPFVRLSLPFRLVQKTSPTLSSIQGCPRSNIAPAASIHACTAPTSLIHAILAAAPSSAIVRDVLATVRVVCTAAVRTTAVRHPASPIHAGVSATAPAPAVVRATTALRLANGPSPASPVPYAAPSC
jgi:hypothetical protein